MNRKFAAVAAAGLLGLSAFAVPTEASARCRGCAVGAGVFGGLVAGAIIGSIARAATAPPAYYAPGYGHGYGHGYAPGYAYQPAPAYAPTYAYRRAPVYAPAYEDETAAYGGGYGCQWVDRGRWEEHEGVKRFQSAPSCE